MSGAMRGRVALVVALALAGLAASAAEPPPAEPASPSWPGGREPSPPWRNELLLVPRLVLTLPRFTVRAVAWPVRGALELNERYQIYQRVIDALTSADGLVGVRPSFDFALDYQPLVGLSFFDERIVGPGTALYARAATGGPHLVLASALFRPLADARRATLELEAAYLLRDDQVFRAIPSLSTAAQDFGNSRYQLSALDLWIRPRLQVTRALQLAFAAELGSRRYGDGRDGGDPPISERYCVRALGRCVPGTVDERLVPGFHEGVDFARAGVALHLDTFDRPTRPSAGVQLDVGGQFSHSLVDATSWAHVFGNVGVAVDLWQETSILVLRIATDLVEPTAGTVPFTELASLGGADSLRGFRAGRFRDFSTVMASAEYRWPIWMWADAMLFVDYGGAAGRGYAGLTFASLHPDIGAGIRVRTSEHVMVRAYVAYGFPDGVQLGLFLGGSP